MQVTETLSEGLKHEFKVSVPASDLDAKADARLVDMKDKVRLNGFRPGKVPVSHLKKVYGRSVMAEVVQNAVNEANRQIVTDNGLKLALEPQVEFPTDQAEVEKERVKLNDKIDDYKYYPIVQLSLFYAF